MPVDLEPFLVDVRKACELLGGVSSRWLWTATHDGRIPSVKCGRRVMYDVSDLKQFIQNHKQGN